MHIYQGRRGSPLILGGKAIEFFLKRPLDIIAGIGYNIEHKDGGRKPSERRDKNDVLHRKGN